jgi:asparagine synthase (glutamine-hydrolysing)
VSVFAGIWSFDGGIAVDAACANMLSALGMYGGDGQAQFSSAELALGRRLLRLLPEDDFDRQPLAGAGVTAMVADVRLDNREGLGSELGLSKERLAGMADSEVLLSAWQRWRDACVHHLSGAFSFAVWDSTEQRLFLARDHTGERPLFYAANSNSFGFASMPQGLHALPFVGDEIDTEYVAHYLTLARLPIDRTIFRRIRRLPSGCALIVTQAQTKVWHYWQTDGLSELRLGSPEEYLQCFQERFDRAVRVRLRRRGGLGALLSGGLDSGAVAATAARLLAAEGSGLTCFTAVPRPGFAGTGITTHLEDEGEAAAEVASMYPNMRHRLVDSSDTSFLDILDAHNSYYDHPCFGPSNEVWLNAIMKQAQKDGITVMLNGNSGNATFSNYGMESLSAWFRAGDWSTLFRVAWQLRSEGNGSVRGLMRHTLGPSLPFWVRSRIDPHMRGFDLDYSMLRPEVAKRLDLERIAFHGLNESPSDGRGMLRGLLTRGDVSDTPTASRGGWGIDFRDPTYDRGVVEFCLTVPLEEFVRAGQLRSLARRSMVGRLPDSTLTRRQRGLQSADWYVNMGMVRERMAAEVERLAKSPLVHSLIDLERMRSLIEQWPSEGFDRPEIQRSYHIALTRGFSVGKFLMRYDSAVRE